MSTGSRTVDGLPLRESYGHVKAKDVLGFFKWRELSKDIKAMLKKPRLSIMERDYKLIDSACNLSIKAHLDQGNADEAATMFIDYFEKNHDGDALLRFCEFLREEAEEAGGVARLKDLADKIERAVKGSSDSQPGIGDNQPDGAVHVKKSTSTIPGLVPSNSFPDEPIDTPPTSSTDAQLVSFPSIEKVERNFHLLTADVNGYIFDLSDKDYSSLHYYCQLRVGSLQKGPLSSNLPELPKAREELMVALSKYWNALSFGLLEDVVNYKVFNMSELLERLKAHTDLLGNFCRTTLGECRKNGIKLHKLQHLKITFQEDPTKFALGKILKFQNFLKEKCGIEQSLFEGFDIGSVILFFLISHDAASRLRSRLNDSAATLSSLGVCRIEFEGLWELSPQTQGTHPRSGMYSQTSSSLEVVRASKNPCAMAKVVCEEESIQASLSLRPSGDIVKLILGPDGLFLYLEENLSVDNELAAQLYGLNLLGDPPYSEICTLNNNGKHQEAFAHWYSYASKNYTGKSLNNLCKCLRRVGENARPLLTEVAKKIEKAIRKVKSSEVGRPLELCKPCHLTFTSPNPLSPDPSSPGPVSPPGNGPYDFPTNRLPGDQSNKDKRKNLFKRMLSQELSDDECLMSLPVVEQVDKHFKKLVDAVQSHICKCEDFLALRHHCRQYLGQLLRRHIPSDLPMLPEAKEEFFYGVLKYWNALSYGLLEAIAEHLQAKNLNKRLDEYKSNVAQSVSVTLGECEWKQVKMFRAQYLKVTYSEDPNKFELSRIQQFQEFLEARCGINRSLFVGAEKGSVILFFLIPREAADRLHSEVDYSKLCSLKVRCIEFEGEWQRTILTPIEESKCQDQVHDCVSEAIKSLVRDRLNDDQCKVCFDESEWKSFKESLLITYTSLNILESNSKATADPMFEQGDKILKCQLKMKKTHSISTNVSSSRLNAIGSAIGKNSFAGAGVGLVTGGGVGGGIGAGIGATVGTVVLPCVGTAVGAVAGAGIGLFVGTVPGVVGGWGVARMARRLFRRPPEDSKVLIVTAEDVFCKFKNFRKDGGDVYACVEINTTLETSSLDE